MQLPAKSVYLSCVSKAGRGKMTRAGSEGITAESEAIATRFRSSGGSIRGDLIDSILPRPFQSFGAQDNDRFVFVSRRRPSSFPAGHNFRAVARSLAGGERTRGERGARYPCEFTAANILRYLHEIGEHMRRLNKTAPFSAIVLVIYIYPRARTRMIYFVAAVFVRQLCRIVVCNVFTECSLN